MPQSNFEIKIEDFFKNIIYNSHLNLFVVKVVLLKRLMTRLQGGNTLSDEAKPYPWCEIILVVK